MQVSARANRRTWWRPFFIIASVALMPSRGMALASADHPAAMLLYPYVRTSTARNISTVLALSNVSEQSVNVHCFVEDATGTCPDTSSCAGDDDCDGAECSNDYSLSDFRLQLVPRQSIGWSVAAGLDQAPSGTIQIPALPAELFAAVRCLVESSAGVPLVTNALAGRATILRPGQTSAAYNAVGFVGATSNGDLSLLVGGEEAEYEGCPDLLNLSHTYEGANDPITGQAAHTSLVVVPCAFDAVTGVPTSTSLSLSLPGPDFDNPVLVGPLAVSGPTLLPLRYLGNELTSLQRGQAAGLTRITSSTHGVVMLALEQLSRPSPAGDALAARNVHGVGARDSADLVLLPVPPPQFEVDPVDVPAALPGGFACLPVKVRGTMPLSAQSRLDYNPSFASFVSAAINPAIGPGSVPDKALTHQHLGCAAPNQCAEQFTVSGTNAVPIPDGVLYTAIFLVDPSVPDGTSPLAQIPGASLKVTSCNGDCSGNAQVSIGEVQKVVNLFLGAPLCNGADISKSCPVADMDRNGIVSLGEIQQAVLRFFSNC